MEKMKIRNILLASTLMLAASPALAGSWATPRNDGASVQGSVAPISLPRGWLGLGHMPGDIVVERKNFTLWPMRRVI
jgi:hypothetical protein